MYFFGRGISAFFNQLFRWLFWNKKGNKVLFTIVFFIIAICFIKLGEVSAVEVTEDINYKAYTYYESVVNEAILRLSDNWENLSQEVKDIILSDNRWFYFYYGNADGSSYNNAKPVNNQTLYIMYIGKGGQSNMTATSNDYMAITGMTMYQRTYTSALQVSSSNNVTILSQSTRYLPFDFVQTYMSNNWVTFINSIKYGDTATLVALLEDIREDLSNTTPDQETEDSVVVDSSAVDSISTASVDNVFSSLFTTLGNKFNNYDLSVTESWVWNLMGTRITFYSDTIYKVIKGTFMETLITSLWLYITGHYAFAWLSKLIHSIKDGSILNGIEMNEVLTKEIL